MCHTSRLEVLLGSWSGSPHSTWCTWQQCMSQGEVRLRLGGDRRIRVSGGTRLFHQLTLVSIAATLSTALHCLDEQCSQCNTIYRTSFRTLMLQSILHYTIWTRGDRLMQTDVIMHTSSSTLNEPCKRPATSCCTIHNLRNPPCSRTHPATAAGRAPRKKPPCASRSYSARCNRVRPSSPIPGFQDMFRNYRYMVQSQSAKLLTSNFRMRFQK